MCVNVFEIGGDRFVELSLNVGLTFLGVPFVFTSFASGFKFVLSRYAMFLRDLEFP